MQFTNEELQNIAVLLQRCNITGAEALPVAMLQQKIKVELEKIKQMLTPVEEKKDGKGNAKPQ